MRTCIICRTEKSATEFNDEHVIPDSIGGYYHIYSVCTDCNSNLGSKVDNKLTNHQFVNFQRHLTGTKGKSGKVPNPFSGTHTLRDDEEQKVRLELNKDGVFEVRLIPNVPKAFTNEFKIVVDKKDEHKTNEIINKFLKRNGIPKEKVQIHKIEGTTERPWVHTSMTIDIKDFKIGILKIIYEFAVDSIPEYFNHPKAIVISEILKNADFENLYEKINFIGDGFSQKILEPFSHFIDFENDNHYLILFDSDEYGLIGIVNLFNVFHLGVRLSEKGGFLTDPLIIGKNDSEKRSFEKYTTAQLVDHIFTPNEFQFQYTFPDEISLKAFQSNELDSNFSFYEVEGRIPFLHSDGTLAYASIDEKLVQPQLTKVPSGNTVNTMATEFKLDEELYLKLMPMDKLVRVISVRTVRKRIRKL